MAELVAVSNIVAAAKKTESLSQKFSEPNQRQVEMSRGARFHCSDNVLTTASSSNGNTTAST